MTAMQIQGWYGARSARFITTAQTASINDFRVICILEKPLALKILSLTCRRYLTYAVQGNGDGSEKLQTNLYYELTAQC